jgi:hypothetical protein
MMEITEISSVRKSPLSRRPACQRSQLAAGEDLSIADFVPDGYADQFVWKSIIPFIIEVVLYHDDSILFLAVKRDNGGVILNGDLHGLLEKYVAGDLFPAPDILNLFGRVKGAGHKTDEDESKSKP